MTTGEPRIRDFRPADLPSVHAVRRGVRAGLRVVPRGLNAAHPDHAGCRPGTRLYGEALERMRQRGVEVASVSTGRDPSDAPARRA